MIVQRIVYGRRARAYVGNGEDGVRGVAVVSGLRVTVFLLARLAIYSKIVVSFPRPCHLRTSNLRRKFGYFGDVPQFLGEVPGGQTRVNIIYCKTSPEEKQPSRKKSNRRRKKSRFGAVK